MTTGGGDLRWTPAAPAGVHLVPERDVGPVAAAATSRGIPCVRVELRDAATKASFLDRLAGALGLPARSVPNWDALADSLGDVRRPGSPGLVLLLLGGDRLRGQSPGEFQTAMDVLRASAREWAERGCPLWVFVALPDEPPHATRPGGR
jgi:hypothetical protein